MYGPIFSVLLMGMLPVWGIGSPQPGTAGLTIAPPAAELHRELPVLTMPRRMSASGVLVKDLESGQTLFQRSAQVPRPMASLTKLMTALLTIEHHELDEWVTVPPEVADVAGTTAKLPAGERFSIGDLLSALLVPSGNDAAMTLAKYHSGSTKAFVQAMNERAAELGLKDTVYLNSSGLDAAGQQSSPRDVAFLASYLLTYPAVAERMGLRTVSIHGAKGTIITLSHTHQLLQEDARVVAGKTGTTDGAGQCLLSVVETNGRRYLVVILHSSDRYADMRTVLDALGPDAQ